jgi:glycoprotein endo-alpha-1,2-mannosidase
MAKKTHLKLAFLAFKVAAVFLCSGPTGFSQTTNSFFQFVNDQSERRYSAVPHEVLAFYYPWYGQPPGRDPWHGYDTNNHEIFGAAHYPVKGPYSSHDLEVLDWQIDQAKAYGITGFVVSWWGSGDWEAWNNKTLSLLLDEAEKKDFKIAIHWEIAPGEGQEQIDRAINELTWALKKYGSRKAFLKVDGKPVIFPYNLVMQQVPAASWPKIIEGVRAGFGDFIIMADGHQDHYAYLFDGIHSYALDHFPVDLERNLTTDKLGELRAWVAQYYENGVRISRRRSRISCVMVTPGGDSRKAYKTSNYTDRLDGQMYRTLWEEAIKANPDWIIITSWNEWPEGSEIEPSLELGDKYLKITAEYAKPFLNSPPVSVPKPSDLPKFVPGTTRELDTILSGRKIAEMIYDQFTDAEFWAAYCGATLQRLDWKDLIDSKVFNASNFPVLIHVGGEHYTSSVKVTDDVTWSLIRYLREGGFLVSLPVGTWPMLYDDSRKGIPFGITDKLELGVDNGFDQPTAGTELKFYVNTNFLLGLSSTAPFPTTGDLRFRPANRSRVPSVDYYLPLVLLWDAQMHHQGEAAVYIQHRTALLSPGKSIYVWMRTPEALGSDEFYPSLYQFISTKLKPLPADK